MPNTNPTFEEAVNRLSEIVKQLERGDAALDESLRIYEEGTRLAAYCQERLKAAEQKITKLTQAAEPSDQSDDGLDSAGE